MAATGKDIAKIAGCSAATVSRVLSNSAPVSRQTRETVLKAIRETGVVPRRRVRRRSSVPAAAGGAAKTSGLVEVVMHLTAPIEHLEIVGGEAKLGPIAPCPPDRFFKPENRYSNSHFRRIIDGAMDELARWRMRAVLRTTDTLEGNQLLEDIHALGVQGLILLGNEGPAVESFLRRCRFPLVSFVGAARDGWPPSVTSDDLPGIRQAVRHLAELGHTRIGYVAGRQEVSAFRDRLTAFKVAMIEADLPVRGDWVYDGSTHIAEITDGVERILARSDRPTAMLGCFDGAALGVMHAGRRCGLSVPRDLSVIGFGNQDVADLLRPGLTSVDASTYEMGRAAVKLLMMQQNQPRATDGLSVRLRTSLVERASTGPAPSPVA